MEDKINNDFITETDYKLLIDNMLNGYAYCKMIFNVLGKPVDWTYIKVNKRFEELVGIKNIEGKKVSKAIPGIKESNQELFELYGKAAKNGTAGRVETYVAPLKKWFSVSAYSPKQGYFAAVFDTITEQKETEENLRKIEKRFKSLTAVIAQVVWITNANGEIVDDLPAWREITGQSREEIKGQGWLKAVHPDDQARIAAIWEKSVKTKSRYQVEYRIRKKNGEYMLVEVKGVPVVNENGNISEWVGITTDITERKAAEKKLTERTEELEKINSFMVGRELKMAEMKEEIEKLKKHKG